MERIVGHIMQLLSQHECVMIPDFGGFVLRSFPAEYIEENNFFVPSRKEIVFNPTLTHNDGLLRKSYMQQYTINFAEAYILIKDDVAELKKLLEGNTKLQFGSIGLFFKENGRLIFEPDKRVCELYSIQFYGLSFFNFLPLTARHSFDSDTMGMSGSENETNVETRKNPGPGRNVIYTIPVTRTFIQIVTATAAAILLLLILPTPVNDVNKTYYSASFVPPEIMPKKSAGEIVADAFSMSNDATNNMDGFVNESMHSTMENVAESDVKTGISDSETANPVITDHTSTSTSKSESTVSMNATAKNATPSSTTSQSDIASANTAMSSAPGMKYYVIIGSFNTEARAQTQINRLSNSEKANAGFVVKDGHVRVYAQYFSSEKEAQSYRTKIRQSHADAWIYKGP